MPDYDIDANEIARYDKKRRGQELTSAAEPIMNYQQLCNAEKPRRYLQRHG